MNYLTSNKSNNEKIYNWLFGCLLIGFTALKFKDLFLPYFWDELGVYSQCAVYQFHNSLSLMPASLPPVISRGHPLLFTFCNAIVMQLFGSSVVVAHSFNLFVSLVLLGVVYFYISKYFNRLIAFITVVLLAIQPIFVTQSILVIPEVMLSLFIFLSLVNYFEEKYVRFGIFASLAILVKESAIVLPSVAVGYSAFQFIFYRNNKNAFQVKNLFFTCFPYFVFGGFLLIQKEQNGWYFFPYHFQDSSFSIEKTATQFPHFYDVVFWQHGRYWWMKIMLVGLLLSFFKGRITLNRFRGNFFVLSSIFMIAFLGFASLSFFGERYIFASLIFASLMAAASISVIFTNRFLALGITALLCIVAIQHREENNVFHYDVDMGYRRQVIAMKQAINYVENLSGSRKYVISYFPVFYAISFPEGGYLKAKSTIHPFTDFKDNGSYYFVRSSPGDDRKPDERIFEQRELAKFKDGFAETTVYELIKRE